MGGESFVGPWNANGMVFGPLGHRRPWELYKTPDSVYFYHVLQEILRCKPPFFFL